MASKGPVFVSKDDLLEIAFKMRDAQNRFYREGRKDADYMEARSLEGKFDVARRAYQRGLNVAPPLSGFSIDEVRGIKPDV